jgi:cytochrome c oxidase subunit 2
MTPWSVFYLFLSLAAVIMLVFAYVGFSAGTGGEVDYGSANRARRTFFIVLTGVLVVGLALTLPSMPYPAEAPGADRVIHVAGKQYAFALSEAPITSAEQYEEEGYSGSVEVAAGSLVEFRVTSLDVNHGFSLYDPNGHLIAQTQAMPGYVNRLRLRLEKPGRYTVLCLEYCGMGHHRMRGVVDVK